jgi:phosphate transport system substrate-binding protein
MRMTVLAVAMACALFGVGVKAETVTIQGAGATFPAPLYAKWIDAYNKANPNVKVDYQAIGSGGGIKAITDRTVQFGGSDGPMTDEQLAAAPGKIVHIPAVSGPEVMIYNLPSVKELTLSGEVVAGIYLGKITKWNDPKIAAINGSVALPDKDIVVVHRSDGSGTTWIFTNYLCKVSAEWKQKAGNATSVKWPVGLGGKGNDGVAAAVQQTEGGIGYVELAFAEKSKMPYATQINKAGKAVRASIEGVVAAEKGSLSDFPDDMRVSITNADGDDAYPICGFTYLLVYQDMSYMKDKAKAAATMKYINWCVHQGQDMAKPNYSPLPLEVQQKVEAKLETIVFDGEALVK